MDGIELLVGIAVGMFWMHLLHSTDFNDWGDPEPDDVQDDPAMYQKALDELPAYLKRQAE